MNQIQRALCFRSYATGLFLTLMLASLGAAESIEGIGPAGPVQQVQSGFAFTEGPAWHPTNAILYFTDIPANRINQLRDGKISVAFEPSHHANGLMVDEASGLKT